MSCGAIRVAGKAGTSFEGVCSRENIGHRLYRGAQDLKRNESISLEKRFP